MNSTEKKMKITFLRPIWFLVKRILEVLGYMTISREKYNYLNDSMTALEGIKRWSGGDIPKTITEFISQNIQRNGNYSQLQADFVALFFNRSMPGFFVEFCLLLLKMNQIKY